jgi:nitrate reductase gamma subunit
MAFFIFIAGNGMQIVKAIQKKRFAPPLKLYPEKKPSFLWALSDTFFFPMVRQSNPILWLFLIIFHICLFLLFIGHLELIGEISMFQIIAHEVFIGKGLVGLMILFALLFFLFRRFAAPVRQFSVPEDYFLLILIFLTAVFGSQMDWARTWYDYGELSVDGYRMYLSSLFSLVPDISPVMDTGHTFMLVLHVFFANLLLMFFPFSKLVHAIFTVPLNIIRRGK